MEATMTELEMTGQKNSSEIHGSCFTIERLKNAHTINHSPLSMGLHPSQHTPLLRIPGHSKIGPHLQLSIKGVVELVVCQSVTGVGEGQKG